MPQTLWEVGGKADFEPRRVVLRLELNEIEPPCFGCVRFERSILVYAYAIPSLTEMIPDSSQVVFSDIGDGLPTVIRTTFLPRLDTQSLEYLEEVLLPMQPKNLGGIDHRDETIAS